MNANFPGSEAYVVAGSVIDWGGNPSSQTGNGVYDDAVTARVLPLLASTGRYVNLSASRLAGYQHPYIVVRVTCVTDRAQLADVMADIEGAFYQADLVPNSHAMYVASAPASSNANAARTGTGGTTPAAAGNVPATNNTPNATGGWFCSDGYEWSWERMACVIPGSVPATKPDSTNIFDDLANALGVTPTQAAVIGIVGALVAVAAIKRVL